MTIHVILAPLFLFPTPSTVPTLKLHLGGGGWDVKGIYEGTFSTPIPSLPSLSTRVCNYIIPVATLITECTVYVQTSACMHDIVSLMVFVLTWGSAWYNIPVRLNL